MSLARRLQLLDVAAAAGALILEDDYDSEIRYDGRPIAALQGLAGIDQVAYVGTFAKTMMPGIRAGYIVAPASLVGVLESAQRYTGHLLPAPVQAALAHFVAAGHYASHVRRMREIYRRRRDRLLNALQRKVGPALRVHVPAGGLQLAAELPAHVDDAELCARLLRSGVASLPLSRHYLQSPNKGLVLGFAAPDEREIEQGADRLATALARL